MNKIIELIYYSDCIRVLQLISNRQYNEKVYKYIYISSVCDVSYNIIIIRKFCSTFTSSLITFSIIKYYFHFELLKVNLINYQLYNINLICRCCCKVKRNN